MAKSRQAQTQLLHGTCVVVGGCGVLILGPPGSGKSDLALRLIDQPGRGIGADTMTARLVADDQVAITRHDERLFAAPPPRLAGLIEVRGLGVVRTDHAPDAELRLAVRLTVTSRIERLPEAGDNLVLLGVSLPQIDIDASAASASARLRAAVIEISRQPSVTPAKAGAS
ncbi:MAG: HPr kinase/phosphorylase [Hyphomicrobiales bacterium]